MSTPTQRSKYDCTTNNKSRLLGLMSYICSETVYRSLYMLGRGSSTGSLVGLLYPYQSFPGRPGHHLMTKSRIVTFEPHGQCINQKILRSTYVWYAV